ncbi:MAG: FAD:protein FMN transferase [Corallococcus sp.]|nr:FAD:protein FMN transferase [Corallococcus sp.]
MNKVKRAILIFLVVTLACSLLSACNAENDGYFEPVESGYFLRALTENDGFVGANLYGLYFGAANIDVEVSVYSSADFNLNFDVRSKYLSDAQLSNRNRLVRLFNEINKFINKIDSLADTQTETSDVYRYNHAVCGTKLEIDEHTYNIMLVAKEMYSATNGAFNPAVYRSVDLWGFSSRLYSEPKYGEAYDRTWNRSDDGDLYYPLPSEEYVQAFSEPDFTDFSDKAVILSVEDGKYYVTKNVSPAHVGGETYEQWIDLGGVAKGYVADCIEKLLRETGIDSFSVNVGSSSMTLGKNYDGQSAVLGIESPFSMQLMLFVDVSDVAMSTSGQYIRKYNVDGTEYAHIIDGSTGSPAQTGIKSVSVIAPSGSLWAGKGDCLTTALTVMGRDGIVDFMNGYLKENGIKVFAVYQEGDGKQILSNVEFDDLAYTSGEISEFSWNVGSADGVFAYDGDAPLLSYTVVPPKANKRDFTWLLITLSVLAVLGIAAVIVYHFLRGKKKVASNIVNAKKDKPFKIPDVGVYVAVVLFVLVLFGVFFLGDGENSDVIKEVRVIDYETQQVLFVCNVNNRSWNCYDGVNGWNVTVEAADDLTVTFVKQIDGEERFNKMTVSVSDGVSVKMTDSLCGLHQECVRYFPALTRPDGAIVCRPNKLKIITE